MAQPSPESIALRFASSPSAPSPSPASGRTADPKPIDVHASVAGPTAAFLVDHASFAYAGGRRALNEVTLAVPSGAILGLLGPNGSGKTTLLHLLAGLLRPQTGRVLLDGRPVERYPRRQLAQRVALVPQTPGGSFGFSALEVVLMGRYPHLGPLTLEGPEDFRIARAALAATDATDLETRAVDTLSGGERQRVALASALAQTAGALLLDEPTSSLDLRHQVELADLIGRLNTREGTTFVISTHDVSFASSFCTHIVLLRDGQLLAAGATRDTLTAEALRELFDVDVVVRDYEGTGRLTVVPIARLR